MAINVDLDGVIELAWQAIFGNQVENFVCFY